MYNSQLSAIDLAKAGKILLLVFSLFVGTQYYTAHANTAPAVSVNPNEFVQQAQPMQQLTISPEKIKEKHIEDSYNKAKYLSVVETTEKVHFSKNDLFCLAKNIYHEAGNQSTKGKLAVAQVTINRTQDPKFAGSVCDVVFAKNQFSWTLNRHLRWSRPHGEVWEESMRLAKAALEDGLRVKGMENALYYHANYVNPGWRNVARLTQIGAHIFYERDA